MAEEIPAALLSKLAPEMNLNQLKKILKVPSLDSLSQQLSLLNPEEIFKSTGFNANINDLFSEITNFENNLGLYLPINDFLPQLPSPQILEQTIQSVTQGFDINGQLQGIVQSYLGNNFQIPDFSSGQVDIGQVFSDTFSSFGNFNSNTFNFAKQQVSNNLQNIANFSNMSSILNSINTSVPSQISPKQIRDFASNPQMLDSFVQRNSITAGSNVGQQVKENAKNYQGSFTGGDNTQVKAGPVPPNSESPNDFKIDATVTTYSAEQRLGKGGDKWSRAKVSSTSKEEGGVSQPNLIEGVSCAVDPSQIPYGSKIVFDNPAIGTRVAMDTGEDVYLQIAARKRGINPSKPPEGAQLPYSQGSAFAKTDQQARSGGINSKGKAYATKTSGTLSLTNSRGEVVGTYKFVNGGAGKGSIPFGNYTVSNYQTARQRAAEGRKKTGILAGADTFDLNNVYDPIVGATRSGLLIHKSRGGTEGCIGIEGGDAVWADFRNKMKGLMEENGGKYSLTLGPDANPSQQASKNLTVDIYFDTEQSRLNFEKNVLSSGKPQSATVQPPKSGVYAQTVTYPSGRKIQAYYPEGYKQLKTRSADDLLKVAGNA